MLFILVYYYAPCSGNYYTSVSGCCQLDVSSRGALFAAKRYSETSPHPSPLPNGAREQVPFPLQGEGEGGAFLYPTDGATRHGRLAVT